LTGQDKVFNNHFIGELKTRKTNPSIRNIETKLIIELSIAGFEKVNFIHKEK
jgi:hypothetical protein